MDTLSWTPCHGSVNHGMNKCKIKYISDPLVKQTIQSPAFNIEKSLPKPCLSQIGNQNSLGCDHAY
jgi:hypothetical protein